MQCGELAAGKSAAESERAWLNEELQLAQFKLDETSTELQAAGEELTTARQQLAQQNAQVLTIDVLVVTVKGEAEYDEK